MTAKGTYTMPATSKIDAMRQDFPEALTMPVA